MREDSLLSLAMFWSVYLYRDESVESLQSRQSTVTRDVRGTTHSSLYTCTHQSSVLSLTHTQTHRVDIRSCVCVCERERERVYENRMYIRVTHTLCMRERESIRDSSLWNLTQVTSAMKPG